MLANLTFYLCFFMTGFVGSVDTIHEMVPHAYALHFNRHMPEGLPITVYLLLVLTILQVLPLSPWIHLALMFGAMIHLAMRVENPWVFGLGLLAAWVITWPWWQMPWSQDGTAVLVFVMLWASNYWREWFGQNEWRVVVKLIGLTAGFWMLARATHPHWPMHVTLAAWLMSLAVLYAAHWYDRVMIVRHVENQRLFYAHAHDELTDVRTLALFRRDYKRYQHFLHTDAGKPLHLAMVDIDHFKQINDTYGHLIGNEVLISFAKDCEQYLADKPYYCGLYRTGGEEFSIFIYGLTATAAQRELSIYTKRLTDLVVSPSHPEIRITLSIGICQNQGVAEPLNELIARSDERLYRAKQTGRNRIVALETR